MTTRARNRKLQEQRREHRAKRLKEEKLSRAKAVKRREQRAERAIAKLKVVTRNGRYYEVSEAGKKKRISKNEASYRRLEARVIRDRLEEKKHRDRSEAAKRGWIKRRGISIIDQLVKKGAKKGLSRYEVAKEEYPQIQEIFDVPSSEAFWYIMSPSVLAA